MLRDLTNKKYNIGAGTKTSDSENILHHYQLAGVV